jgi:hypothetical protein
MSFDLADPKCDPTKVYKTMVKELRIAINGGIEYTEMIVWFSEKSGKFNRDIRPWVDLFIKMNWIRDYKYKTPADQGRSYLRIQ